MYLKNTMQDSELSHCCIIRSNFQISWVNMEIVTTGPDPQLQPITQLGKNRFSPTPAFWCATAGGSRGCKFYKTTKIIKFHLPALLMHVLFSLHMLLHWNRHGVKDYRGEEKTNLWPALDELRLPFWWHISFCSTAGTGVILVSGSISFSTWLRGHLGSGLLFSLLLFFKFCQLFTK